MYRIELTDEEMALVADLLAIHLNACIKSGDAEEAKRKLPLFEKFRGHGINLDYYLDNKWKEVLREE